AFEWVDGQLTQKWAWASDWKPEPNSPAVGSSPTERWGLLGWDPVFHAVLVGNWAYAPRANGAIWKINKNTGAAQKSISPFPAIAPDGTAYTVSRAHFRTRYGYVIAVNPDLTPRWAGSLRGHLSDGCNDGTQFSVLPPSGTPGGCIAGAHAGVDPASNSLPAGRVIDQSSSSPTVAPDGSVLYGAYSRYNFARGHMFKFSSTG